MLNRMIFFRSEHIEFVLITDGVLRFEEHSHSSDIIISAMLDGSAELSVNGTRQTVSAGELFSVLPYENHSLISETAVCMLSMCISKELLFCNKERRCQIVSAAVEGLWQRPEFENTDREICIKLIDAAEMICEAANLADGEDSALSGERSRIETCPESDEDIDALARNAYMSKYHFIRRFREISGLTPNRFRIQTRIRKAQKLLGEGTAIADTALMSGFYDQSHFDKYFKRIVGVSPKEYIQSLRNFVQE